MSISKRLLAVLSSILSGALVLIATAALAATTIFSTALGSSNTGNGGCSFVTDIATTTGNSQGQIAVSILSAGGALQTDHVSYCLATTSPSCNSASLGSDFVEVTYPASCGTGCTGGSGGHGFALAATGETALSNFVTFAPTGTHVIVTMDINSGSPGDIAFGGGVTGAGTPFFKCSGVSWNTGTRTGFTSGTAGQDFGVTLIQTQAGAGATTPQGTLLGVGP